MDATESDQTADPRPPPVSPSFGWRVAKWGAASLATATGLLGLLLAVCLAGGCRTVSESDAKVDMAKVEGMETFDYSEWDKLLEEFVDDQGRVDYDGLLEERQRLDEFVAVLGKIGPQTRPELFADDDAKLAYYINAYNALTMFNVINRLPGLESVIDEKLNFFYLTEFPLDGETAALYDLENEIIRPTFKEPRIHFALNCASIGCPQLPAEAFLPDTLQAQLERETDKFLHETRNVELQDDGSVLLSEIFSFYPEDFDDDPLAWVRAKAPDLDLPADAEIGYRPYDWALNKQ